MGAGNYDEVVENGNQYKSGGYLRLMYNNNSRGEKYWYNEEKFVNELKDYIAETYAKHYVGSKFQSLDAIIESGNGAGFFMGNIQKYAFRYGKKNGFNRLDLLKILHYGILMLFCHDRNVRDGTVGENSDGTNTN